MNENKEKFRVIILFIFSIGENWWQLGNCLQKVKSYNTNHGDKIRNKFKDKEWKPIMVKMGG
jgi:hypothetical protein